MPDPSSSPLRDRPTMVVGGSYLVLGVINGSLGPVSDQLRTEFDLSATVTGIYGSTFGWALLVAALAAGPLRRRLDDSRLFLGGLGLAVLAVGVMAIAPNAPVSLVGAAMVATAATSLVMSAPSLIAARHRDHSERGEAYTLVNALSQAGAVVSPLVLALALRLAWGWRVPWLAMVFAVGVTVLVIGSRTLLPQLPSEASAPAGPLEVLGRSTSIRRRWLVLILGVGVEFTALLWGSPAVQRLGDATPALGAVGVGLFGGGMLLGRLLGPSLTRRWSQTIVLRCAFVGSALASLVVATGPGALLRIAALGATGLFLSIVYPFAFHRLYGPRVTDAEVTTLGAFAAGIAISVAPPLLGLLADGFGLGRAIYIAPVMATVAALLLPESDDPGVLAAETAAADPLAPIV